LISSLTEILTYAYDFIGFDEGTLKLTVQVIGLETGWLLEIVNYNIANSQYVCAGEV